MAALSGHAAPQSSTFGLNAVYAAMSSVSYSAATSGYKVTPDLGPSGAVYYSTTNPTIYYPQGCDWGVGQEIPYAVFDADAAAFNFGSGAATPAATAETEHATAAAAMQLRPQVAGKPASGAMYRDATPPEYIYVGREEHAAQLAAQLYLAEDVSEGKLQYTIMSSPVSLVPAQSASLDQRAALPALNEGRYDR
jgi:hypothetical protein